MKTTLLRIAFSTLVLAFSAASAEAVLVEFLDPSVDACGSPPCGVVIDDYDPLSESGFFSHASVMLDTQTTAAQVVKEAAAYVGDGNEPMLVGTYAATAFAPHIHIPGSSTRARMSVDYRIEVLPGASLPPGPVPVVIDYGYAALLSGYESGVLATVDLMRRGEVVAGFRGQSQLVGGVRSDNLTTRILTGRRPNGSPIYEITEATAAGSIALPLGPTRYTLVLYVAAGGEVVSSSTPGETWSSEAEGIMDPFIQIDPEWLYADLLQVTYQDVDGTWVLARSTPLTGPILAAPEPTTLALFVFGLIGLRTMRRRRQSN